MAITYVGRVGTSSSASGAASSTITVGAGGVAQGDRIVIAALVGNGSVAPAVPTDSGGNTYALDKSVVSGADSAWVWSAHATTALVNGNTIVVNLPSGNTEFIIIIEEYSGILSAGYTDGTNAAVATSNNANSGNVVTANANDLLFGAVGWFSGNLSVTWLNSFTHRDQTSLGTPPLADGLDVGDNIVSATGTYAAAATLSGSPGWLAILTTYQAVAGSGVTPFMASPPEVRVPRGNRLWLLRERPYLSGQKVAFPAPPAQASLDPWPIFQRATVVLRRQPRSRRAASSAPPREQEAAPARNLTRAVRRRTWLSHRGESWIPPWGQAPPNPWQVISSFQARYHFARWWPFRRRAVKAEPEWSPDASLPRAAPSAIHFRRWAAFRRGKGRIFEPPWFQAPPNAWQVVSSFTPIRLFRRWAVFRRGKGRVSEPPWFQAAPNAWQVVSSFSPMRIFRRFAWRRARMHDEPALMPQQALAPNPAIVEFLRTIRRRLPVPRRGKALEPPWGQAAANTNQPPYVDWWRRTRARLLPASRRRLGNLPLTDQAPVAPRLRRRASVVIRRARSSFIPPAVVVTTAPAFVAFWKPARRAWGWLRRRLPRLPFGPPQAAPVRSIGVGVASSTAAVQGIASSAATAQGLAASSTAAIGSASSSAAASGSASSQAAASGGSGQLP